MKTVSISVDWNSIDSVVSAKKQETELKKKGYHIISQFGGMKSTVWLFGK